MSDVEHVPVWVPEIAPGVRADVYPVEPPRPSRAPFCDAPPELKLDREAVTSGYAERRMPYEFASCLPAPVSALSAPTLSSAVPGATPTHGPAAGNGLSPTDLSKLRTGIAVLRRSRPTKLQRVEVCTFAKEETDEPDPADGYVVSGNKKAFPLQKAGGSSSLEDWFNKLSAGAKFDTAELARSVPLWPGIGRNTGKVIEMMASRSVPTQRAAWYIRIAVLNECVKQIRPNRPPPSAKVFWSRQLCALLKTEMEAIRARETAILGSMDRVTFWAYVLDLSRWQADEGLLDCKQWLAQIAAVLRAELVLSQSFTSPGTRIAIKATRRFLPEFLTSTESSHLLLESLLPGAKEIVKAWRGAPAAAAKAAANGAASQGKRDPKSPSRKAAVKRQQFQPNLCHREVTMLLSAAVRVLDGTIIGSPDSEARMSDLERYVKRGMAIMLKSRNRQSLDLGKGVDRILPAQYPNQAFSTDKDKNLSSHLAYRELEMLPGHGDLSRPIKVLYDISKDRGGLGEVVRQVCSWAVAASVTGEAEAVCVGCGVLFSLGLNFGASSRNTTPQAQKPLRCFTLDAHGLRAEGDSASANPPLQREIWGFLKGFAKNKEASTVDGKDRLVRFVAQLCRTGQLSLRVLVRDISRLSSNGHSGVGFLVKVVALLPNPVELHNHLKNSAGALALDCRKPLLRKFGYMTNSRLKQAKANEDVVRAVLTGERDTILSETKKLHRAGDTSATLSTAEVVRARCVGPWLEKRGEIRNRVQGVCSFFLVVKEPNMAVEWLMASLTKVADEVSRGNVDSSRRESTAELLVVMVGLLEDLHRFIAAGGLLEATFLVMEKLWSCSSVTAEVRKRILLSCAAFYCLFDGSLAKPSPYWTRMVLKHVRRKVDNANGVRIHPLAHACMTGKISETLGEKLNLSDILASAKREAALAQEPNAPQRLMIVRQGISSALEEAKRNFGDTSRAFRFQTYLAQGLTTTDIFGGVFIPLLSDALLDSTEARTQQRFSQRLLSALESIRHDEHEVWIQGLWPSVFVEFLSLIIAGCVSGQADANAFFELVDGVRWIWNILGPRAGISLAVDIRRRVEFHYQKVGSIDTNYLLVLLINMVTRFLGDSGRDEAKLAGLLGKEPLGMIETQVALLAAHRKEQGMDQEFGTRMGEAALSLICVDSARSLALATLRSCTEKEWRQIVAGVVGYGAAVAMEESLGFVASALTMEAPESDAVSSEREEWYQADAARRGVLECVVESLSQDVGSQMETNLFDQLATVSALLSSTEERVAIPSSLPQHGRMLSDALESRFQCILRCQRISLPREVWVKRTVDVAELLHHAVPLLKQSAICAGANIIALCVKNLVHIEEPDEDATVPSGATISSPTLDDVEDVELRNKLRNLLRPVLLWLEQPGENVIAELIVARSGFGMQRNDGVRAFGSSGQCVDNWLLLEGFGRGADEEAIIPPAAFGEQERGKKAVDMAGVVKLKRTYSTFASLAV